LPKGSSDWREKGMAHLKAQKVGRPPSRFRKLTPEQVREIRASQLSASALSKQYGVCGTSIKNIKKRYAYKEIE